MKKVLFLTMSVLALTSCKVDLSNMVGDLIEASENVVTKEYKLTAFEEVKMSGVGNVELIQSESKNGIVELTAPDNYIELYKFESNGKRLDISFTKRAINIQTKDVKIKVYTSDLIKIQNSGAANINMEKLDTDQMEILNSGVGASLSAE